MTLQSTGGSKQDWATPPLTKSRGWSGCKKQSIWDMRASYHLNP